MSKNSVERYGATGRKDVLMFDPAQLTLVTEPEHPLYDERINLPVDEGLVRNIMVYGIKEPIIVRLNGNKKDGTPNVEIVDGRQRYRAAIEANKRLSAEGAETLSVPALPNTRGDEGELMGIMISLNEHRRNDNPLVRAKKAVRMLDLGKSEEAVCIAFGITASALEGWKKLVSCCSAVQEAVQNGQVAASIAKELAPLSAEDQKATLEKLIAEGTTRGERAVDEIERVVAEKTNGNGKRKRRTTKGRPGKKELERLLGVLEAAKKEGEALPSASKVLRYALGDREALAKKWLETQ